MLRLYRSGAHGAALEIAEKLALQGMHPMKNFLGGHWFNHRKQPAAVGKAVKWLNAGAWAGYARSQYRLARLYYCGLGVARDRGRAAFWMRHAASRDLAEAQLAYAIYLRRGVGVAKDGKRAALWLERARDAYYFRQPQRQPAAQRRRESLGFMAFLAVVGAGNPIDRPLAIRLYREAQAVGDRRAASRLAWVREEIAEIKSARAAGREPRAKITGCEGFATQD